MQRLLTEKEYTDLVTSLDTYKKSVKDLILTLCIDVATYKPVHFGNWSEAKPWGCWKHGSNKEDYKNSYCDACPVREVCPEEQKRYSK